MERAHLRCALRLQDMDVRNLYYQETNLSATALVVVEPPDGLNVLCITFFTVPTFLPNQVFPEEVITVYTSLSLLVIVTVEESSVFKATKVPAGTETFSIVRAVMDHSVFLIPIFSPNAKSALVESELKRYSMLEKEYSVPKIILGGRLLTALVGLSMFVKTVESSLIMVTPDFMYVTIVLAIALPTFFSTVNKR
jgi:hypothetical protein